MQKTQRNRMRRYLPLVIGVLMLGVMACVCTSTLGNLLPGGGNGEEDVEAVDAALEPATVEEEPTAAPPTEPPPPPGINAENASQVEQISEFLGAEQLSLGMRLTPDGKSVAVYGWDGEIRVFDVENGSETHTLSGHNSLGLGLAFSPDGTQLVSGGDDFRVFMWDWENESALFSFVADTDPADMAWSPDGTKVAYIGLNSSRVFVMDSDGNEIGRISEHGRVLKSVHFSPDGGLIASGNERGNVVISNADSLATVETLNDGTGSLWGMRFSPDGSQLAACSGSGDFYVWDTGSWALERTWFGHSGGCRYLIWTPDGSAIVTGGSDGKVAIWDPFTGRELQSFNYSDGAIWKVDISEAGDVIAALGGKDEGVVRIFAILAGNL